MRESIRESGVGSSTVEGVLKASRVTAGSMYHHFPGGKAALVAAAVRQAGIESEDALSTMLGDPPDPVRCTQLLYDALAAEMEATDYRYGCPVGVPATEAAGNDVVRAATAEAFGRWIAVIEGALQLRGCSPDQAASTARFMVAAYEGASTLARSLRDTGVLHDTKERVIRLLREMLD